MFATRTLAVLGLTAALATGCGSGSGSDSSGPDGGASSGTTTAGTGLEIRPVYARYDPSATGDLHLGPQVPAALIDVMKGYSCGSPATDYQGMLMECDAGTTVYLLKAPIVAGGVQSATAKQIGHTKLWFVAVQLDQAATATLAKLTSTLAGSEIALSLPDRVVAAPVVDASMSDGRIGITGTYDRQQAQKLATQITAG